MIPAKGLSASRCCNGIKKLGGFAMICLTLAWASAGGLFASDSVPKLDKPRLETYLRYAEGYVTGVKFDIDDPKPSPFPGFYRVVVHLTSGDSKLDRSYYVTPDAGHVINGAIWDLNESPFKETLDGLPADGYSFGPANGKVVLVVFSDFECPYCRELAKTVRDNLPQKYPADVRVVFEDFPLSAIHPWARAAAEAARCLGHQKPESFWAFHDWIFEHQKEVTLANLREKTLNIAKDQKLDEAKVGACIDSHETSAEIEKSVLAAKSLQVQQTPTFFINGRVEAGAVNWPTMDALIQFELNRPKEVPGGAAEKCCEVSLPKIGAK